MELTKEQLAKFITPECIQQWVDKMDIPRPDDTDLLRSIDEEFGPTYEGLNEKLIAAARHVATNDFVNRTAPRKPHGVDYERLAKEMGFNPIFFSDRRYLWIYEEVKNAVHEDLKDLLFGRRK
jgi:hypothetical protein